MPIAKQHHPACPYRKYIRQGDFAMKRVRYLIPQLAVLIAPSVSTAATCDPGTVNELLKLGADPALVVSSCQAAARPKTNATEKATAPAATVTTKPAVVAAAEPPTAAKPTDDKKNKDGTKTSEEKKSVPPLSPRQTCFPLANGVWGLPFSAMPTTSSTMRPFKTMSSVPPQNRGRQQNS